MSQKQEDALQHHLSQKKIFLDLGGGHPHEDLHGTPMQKIAEEQGISWYINQDRYLMYEGDHPSPKWEVNDELGIAQPKNMRVDYCTGDIIQSLVRLPDNCENLVIALNGIDDNILGVDLSYKDNENIHKEIAKLIWKKMPENGVVLTCGSTATDFFEAMGFRLVEGFEKSWNGVELWVKPGSEPTMDLPR